jgi:hypothetical protein
VRALAQRQAQDIEAQTPRKCLAGIPAQLQTVSACSVQS